MERDQIIANIKSLVVEWSYEKLLREYLEILKHDLSKMDNKEVLEQLKWFDPYNTIYTDI